MLFFSKQGLWSELLPRSSQRCFRPRYHYQCVIYGWDGKCAANRDWIYQMGVHNLSHEDRQPFYNVLVEDGSNRYAAQGAYAAPFEPPSSTTPCISFCR